MKRGAMKTGAILRIEPTRDDMAIAIADLLGHPSTMNARWHLVRMANGDIYHVHVTEHGETFAALEVFNPDRECHEMVYEKPSRAEPSRRWLPTGRLVGE